MYCNINSIITIFRYFLLNSNLNLIKKIGIIIFINQIILEVYISNKSFSMRIM